MPVHAFYMDPAETQSPLHQQVNQLTMLVSQLLEGQASQSALPASPPRGASSPLVLVSLPEKDDGNPDHCRSFLMQCGLYIEENPERFLADSTQV